MTTDSSPEERKGVAGVSNTSLGRWSLNIAYQQIGCVIVSQQTVAGWGETVFERLACDLRSTSPDFRDSTNGFPTRRVVATCQKTNRWLADMGSQSVFGKARTAPGGRVQTLSGQMQMSDELIQIVLAISSSQHTTIVARCETPANWEHNHRDVCAHHRQITADKNGAGTDAGNGLRTLTDSASCLASIGPRNSAESITLAILLPRLLSTLEPQDRQIVYGQFWEGKTFVEIARELRCPESSVRTKWSRLRNRLRAEYGSQF